MSTNFHLPGIEKLDSFKLVFNEGIDNDIKILAQLAKYEMLKPRTEPLIDVERRLNKLEKVGSLFPDPVQDQDDRNISSVNIEEAQISIPDVDISYHEDIYEQEQNGSEFFEGTSQFHSIDHNTSSQENGNNYEKENRQPSQNIRPIGIA